MLRSIDSSRDGMTQQLRQIDHADPTTRKHPVFK
jgi:hypothetical protein